MIRSARGLHKFAIVATDGPIGAIDDFLFDDERWAIRYVVVDTGRWLPGRLPGQGQPLRHLPCARRAVLRADRARALLSRSASCRSGRLPSRPTLNAALDGRSSDEGCRGL